MKTQIYLTAILVLTIQVMVNGQTQGNRTGERRARILTTIVGNKPTVTPITPKAITAAPTTPVAAITSSSPQNNVYYNSSSYTQLTRQAEELSSDAKFLTQEASKKSGTEKEQLLNQAKILAKQAETNQIKASEIIGKTNKEAFRLNKENLNSILAIDNGDEYSSNQARELIIEATFNIRLAQEMREEAYAMPTSSSKLSSMINAEEKEALAINQQKKAIEILKSSNPELAGSINATISGSTWATR